MQTDGRAKVCQEIFLDSTSQPDPAYSSNAEETDTMLWLHVSSSGNVQLLRHDFHNGPAHVFGDHSSCNAEFCKHVPCSTHDDNAGTSNADMSATEEPANFMTFAEQVEEMIAGKIADEPTSTDETDAHMGQGTDTLASLPTGFFAKVMACGD